MVLFSTGSIARTNPYHMLSIKVAKVISNQNQEGITKTIEKILRSVVLAYWTQ